MTRIYLSRDLCAYAAALLTCHSTMADVTYRYPSDGSQASQKSAQFAAPLAIQTVTTLKVQEGRPGFNPGPEPAVNYTGNISPVVKRFEWTPSPTEVGIPAYFYWNIENVKECFTTTSGSGQPERRAASGTAGPATNAFPYTGTSRWYCTDLQGNRYPANPNSFIEAKRIVEAPILPVKLLPQAGEYADFVDLSINRQSYVKYRYTTDGSAVTTGSALFPATSLRVSKNMVVKVRGYRDGFNPTPEVNAAYKILRNFSVTASAGAGGSIKPSSVRVAEGKTTSFIATPAVGYRLNKIEGCGATSITSPFITSPIAADCQISATFTAQASAQTIYLHNDVLGSVILETDASGNVKKRTEYKPFGESKDN